MEEKPLPELPSGNPGRAHYTSSSLTLTIEARAHVHRLIARALDEEKETRDGEAWTERLETALYDLGASIVREGWLPGLKRARCVRKRHHDEEKKRRIDEQAKKDKEEEERGRNRTGKNRSKLKEEVVVVKDTDDPPDVHRLSTSLEELRGVLSKSLEPTPKPSAKHLLLAVSGSPLSEPSEDTGFKLVRTSVHCAFKPGEFALPMAISEADGGGVYVLYGLDDWNAALLSSENPLQIVGGTFILGGIASLSQYHSICRVLRLAVYAYLSLLLEQDLLCNSHVELHYPKPVIPTLPSFPPIVERSTSSPNIKEKQRRDSGSGLWYFLSKKTEDLLHRAAHVAPMGRRGSIDIPFRSKFPRVTSVPQGPDGGLLSRRLSFLSSIASRSSQESDTPRKTTFATTLRRMDSWKDLMSTSPGVAFPPPRFLQAIAEREAKDPGRRPLGDEKAALSSLLGWQGKESLSSGVVGLPGFVRHQGLTVLYSEHVPGTSMFVNSPPPTPSKSDTTSSTELQVPLRTTCWGHRRKWIHYRYYEHGRQWDESLGEVIIRWCETAEDPCRHPDCHFQRSEHDMRFIHNGVRIITTVSLPTSTEASTSDDLVRMWQSCAICGKASRKEVMHDGSYLFSFAKYLELLFYSPAIHNLDPKLCDHTSFPEKPWSAADTPLPYVRFNIIRKFSYKDRTVTMTMSEMREVFEVRVPRLQILRRKGSQKTHASESNVPTTPNSTGDAHRILRREIMKWWQGLSEYMDKLESQFISDHPSAFHKTLPRLPSTDDPYEEDEEDVSLTPTNRPRPPPSSPTTPKEATDHSYLFLPVFRLDSPATPSEPSSVSTSVLSTSTNDTATPDSVDSLQLLSGLRYKFQRAEQELYAELARTSEKNLNDVRRSFVTSARGATKRLAAWEKKHAPPVNSKAPPGEAHPIAPEPEWWRNGCHAVPGGNIIVREDDLGSIIAFTLSTMDYQRELSNMSSARNSAPPATPAIPTPTRPSLFRAGESFRRLVSGSTSPQPDPDKDDAGWQEPETYSAVISRKEHPREPVSLMVIRDVLRQKASVDSGTSSSLLTTTGMPGGKVSGSETPRSVRAKPAVELSTLAAGGQVSGMPEAVESAGKILHELEAVSKANLSRTSLSDSQRSSSPFFEANIRRGKGSSIISDSDGSTIQEDVGGIVTPPPLPPKVSRDVKDGDSGRRSPVARDGDQPTPTAAEPTSSAFASAFANSLTSAMKYVLKPGDAQRSGSGTATHHLLSTDTPSINERPHIKYDWTIGKRLRFSCTVYYAKQFDQLRRRCGIDDVFLRSLARSENWAAEGGKSKSNFWKTSDDRFIIKTLVNAWNVADLQVLIELGPSYFKYMETTASRPTLLAKLLGFYTVEIRNLESGNSQAKADLLVMENLFCDQKIVKTFDLKGIQGRKVKVSGGLSKTLFDSEWIEGQQRALTLVRPHSKVVFQEAVKADCEFLAKSNIMDYSLLLGINDEDKLMVCGLVDTIGSYTFAKTLEYKAKQGLNSSKEVTVVPPQEYQERFVNAMDDYFLACPGTSQSLMEYVESLADSYRRQRRFNR